MSEDELAAERHYIGLRVPLALFEELRTAAFEDRRSMTSLALEGIRLVLDRREADAA